MQVSQWLGHATYSLTLDVYGDYIPETDGGAQHFARADHSGEVGGPHGSAFIWIKWFSSWRIAL